MNKDEGESEYTVTVETIIYDKDGNVKETITYGTTGGV